MPNSPSNINPNFKRKPSPVYTMVMCLQGIEKGDTKILSYVISKAESHLLEDQKFVSEIIIKLKPKKNTKKIAISGAPGVGKSSFINSFGSYLLSKGQKLAILPVDPSSQLSQGSILGDKTRMEDLVNLDDAYIKPMASSLALGGLAPSSSVAAMICERSIFDFIIMETVGVGQSEYEARHMVDLFVLLLQPGGGDDLQGIKRGIMEMADLMIVTKVDGLLEKNGLQSYKAYQNAMKMFLPNKYGWSSQIFKHSSMTGMGEDDIYNGIKEYFDFMNEEARLGSLRSMQDERLFEKEYKSILLNHIMSNDDVSKTIESLRQQLNKQEIIPLQALETLRQKLND
ncbi:MAG: methylmalonyl Co-A mutase-associated GTPase MeaB [Saprospiraceae bacterium]|nr:methylmalonyl Co-A mutase-associated GTPase MeaB [Bacteroidia bacterium]NNE14342.1 methylmalonyl Co-A mutase-associated GTPase MeaB [Saprospiraceae bacterium]NNL92741.1 methylmalonyl Co-A mutase-associated GTPase MeaB [Saprospiraceae bacterium]